VQTDRTNGGESPGEKIVVIFILGKYSPNSLLKDWCGTPRNRKRAMLRD